MRVATRYSPIVVEPRGDWTVMSGLMFAKVASPMPGTGHD